MLCTYIEGNVLVNDDDDRWRGVGGDSIKYIPAWINRK